MIGQLTNHLWQSTIFAVAAALLAVAFRKNRAQVRYWLWLSASLKFLIPFSLLIGLGSQVPWTPATRAIVTPAVSTTVAEISQPYTFVAPVSRPAESHVDRAPIVVAVWLAGLAAIMSRRAWDWLRIRAAVDAGKPLEIAAMVEARLSPGRLEPGVFGVFRPILLLPEGIVERLTPSQLEAVVAHELCHVRRRDNLFAAFHMVVEAGFWFHPLVWWIGARMVEERERACDEDVVRLGSEPRVYADAIVNVCKFYVESPLTCVAGVSGADIRRRLEAIMTNRMGRSLGRGKKLLLTCAAFAAVAGPIATGLLIGVGHASQSVPTAKFDVVSVKPCAPGDGAGMSGRGKGRGLNVDPGRLRVNCMTVAELIELSLATGKEHGLLNNDSEPLSGESLRGGPAWIRNDRYSIQAETNDPVANGPARPFTAAHSLMTGPMLRALLEDRFQLKTHRETEDAPMYSLTVAKGGLKLKPTPEGGCTPHDPTMGLSVDEMFPPGKTPVCTEWTHFEGPDWAIDGAGQELSNLAGALSFVVDRHVLDKTGVAGVFTYHLRFARDDTAPGQPMVRDRIPPSDNPPGPSVFAALDRVGLKLVSDKGPQEHLAIDSVQRPTEN